MAPVQPDDPLGVGGHRRTLPRARRAGKEARQAPGAGV
jgi:hypothetical protein